MNQPSRLRRELQLVTTAWVFGAGWLYLTTGAALTQFAKLLGLTPFGFGLLAALPFFGALFQIPASYFIERYGYRKPFFITAGILHRALWLVVAFIPWLFPASLRGPALIAVIALSWMAGQIIGPCWVSWMADLVPGPIRGRYFSRRSQVGQFVGLVVTLGIGFVLDQAARRGDVVLLRTLAAGLALAAAAGVSDFLFFIPVGDRPVRPPNPDATLGRMLREPLRDRNFRRFVGWTSTLTFATGFMGQFAWLYVLDVAGMSNTQANAMLVLMPLVVVMMVGPLWGRAVDRFGRKTILLLAGLIIIPGSLA
jgi:MFS family permease